MKIYNINYTETNKIDCIELHIPGKENSGNYNVRYFIDDIYSYDNALLFINLPYESVHSIPKDDILTLGLNEMYPRLKKYGVVI